MEVESNGVISFYIVEVYSKSPKNNLSYFSKFLPSGNPKLTKHYEYAQHFGTVLAAARVGKKLREQLPLRKVVIVIRKVPIGTSTKTKGKFSDVQKISHD